jgi:putative membrane protein
MRDAPSIAVVVLYINHTIEHSTPGAYAEIVFRMGMSSHVREGEAMFRNIFSMHTAAAVLLVLSVAFLVAGQPRDRTAGKLSSAEVDFVKEAAMGGMMEVKLGQLAESRASNRMVKEFGTLMVKDHSRANSDLKELAGKKGVRLAASLDEDHQADYDRLAKLSGLEFDREYMSMMVDDHEKDVDKFKEMSENASDSDLKAFVTKTLPVLQAHLTKARSTNDQIKEVGSND